MSALIDDLHRLGLQEQILLVACGEMGRTPKLNARGGRDHWGGLAPLVISGGGLPMGQIIGQSSRDASEPASEPVTLAHLTATVMHTLLDIGRLRTVQGVPDQVLRAATSAAPIA